MLLASSVSGLFKWRQFEPEVILLAVGWYLRFSLSYRDVIGVQTSLGEQLLDVDSVTAPCHSLTMLVWLSSVRIVWPLSRSQSRSGPSLAETSPNNARNHGCVRLLVPLLGI